MPRKLAKKRKRPGPTGAEKLLRQVKIAAKTGDSFRAWQLYMEASQRYSNQGSLLKSMGLLRVALELTLSPGTKAETLIRLADFAQQQGLYRYAHRTYLDALNALGRLAGQELVSDQTINRIMAVIAKLRVLGQELPETTGPDLVGRAVSRIFSNEAEGGT